MSFAFRDFLEEAEEGDGCKEEAGRVICYRGGGEGSRRWIPELIDFRTRRRG